LAVPIIEVARTMGLKVGEDVRVCGFDDLPIAQVLEITTVRQPIAEMGRLAAETLIKRISGKLKEKPKKIHIETRTGNQEYVVGDSLKWLVDTLKYLEVDDN